MRRRLPALAWVGLLGGIFFASCLARRDKPYVRLTDDDAGAPGPIMLDGSMPDVSPDALELAPHAVLGIDPPHGPHVGDTLVMIRGNGFESNARVWFGDVEVPKGSVTPVDPQRVQVVTPPGAAGAVDIRVQNGTAESTSAVLTGGYTYDPFYAKPSSGATSGGTVITLHGESTNWNADTVVEIDRNPCGGVDVISPTELTCTTPPGEAGAKVLSVITADDERQDVLDGFLYGNSDNGFRGGLSGQPLAGQLTVLALDVYEGAALPGVSVLVGESVEAGQVKRTDKNGVVTFAGDFGDKATVTIAARCLQPITFFDVPVDHITAYLEPVLSPDCGDFGEPPPGGTPGLGSSVTGEVVWEPDGEFKRRGWTNVPAPVTEQEKKVAYVLRLNDRADEALRLPSPTDAITPDAEGSRGYGFYQLTSPGNFTLYALAGLEDRSKSPPQFTAYAMGLLRGVAVKPGKTSDDVFIQIDVPLDHALTLNLDPPEAAARGPDRVRASVAIQIEDQGFALIPSGISEKPLPGASSFSFVGVPPLVGTLAGTKYVLGARAVTGAGGAPPLSVIGSFSTTSTAQPLDLGGFVPLPILVSPAKSTKWDMSSLTLEPSPGGERVDLTVIKIKAGQGLYNWTVVAKGPRRELELPDLGALDPAAALPIGSVVIQVSLARIDAFDYGSLRYRQLTDRGWNAHATDYFLTQH
ncbi:MAG TPA: IPT/TIG domain-containing protein [Polyangiaceae bacterium]|nr:IPT/TIG domain-containing protein [Polyangiaceae bacterium]